MTQYDELKRDLKKDREAFDIKSDEVNFKKTVVAYLQQYTNEYNQPKEEEEKKEEETTLLENPCLILSAEAAEELVTKRRKAGQTFRETFGENTDSATIQDLIDKADIKPEDFQAVFREHQELAQQIGGGKTCENNANNADKKQGPCRGLCLPGSREIIGDSLALNKENQKAYNYIRQPYQNTNGGCSAYYVMNESGNYLSVSMKNKAYGKTPTSYEEQQMDDYLFQVQPGITVSWDSICDPQVRKQQGNTKGGYYGHVAVMGNDGKFHSDGAQKPSQLNNSRYGEYVNISFPLDANVPEQYATLLIEKAQERQEKETMLAQSKTSSSKEQATNKKNLKAQQMAILYRNKKQQI